MVSVDSNERQVLFKNNKVLGLFIIIIGEHFLTCIYRFSEEVYYNGGSVMSIMMTGRGLGGVSPPEMIMISTRPWEMVFDDNFQELNSFFEKFFELPIE